MNSTHRLGLLGRCDSLGNGDSSLGSGGSLLGSNSSLGIRGLIGINDSTNVMPTQPLGAITRCQDFPRGEEPRPKRKKNNRMQKVKI